MRVIKCLHKSTMYYCKHRITTKHFDHLYIIDPDLGLVATGPSKHCHI